MQTNPELGPSWMPPQTLGQRESADEIQIVHLDSSADFSSMRLSGQEALVILWLGSRPIGQLDVLADCNGLLPQRACEELVQIRQQAASTQAEPDERPASDGVRVSLVICTRDRPELLRQCLASVNKQARTPDEVIVVDNGSIDDRTRQVAEGFAVHYVREDRAGLSFARNAGLLAATGEIIAYTDDDVELHELWLARLAAAFESPEILAVTGLVLPAALGSEAEQVFERYWGFGRGYNRIDFGTRFMDEHRFRGCPAWEFGAGANMAFRADAFRSLGLFDVRLGAGASGCSEDSEMWYRILAAGGICRYEPSAVVFHHHRSTMVELRHQIYSYLRGHVAALLVQFEKTGHAGNLARILWWLPKYYARKAASRLLKGKRPDNCLLDCEVRGALAGLFYYMDN